MKQNITIPPIFSNIYFLTITKSGFHRKVPHFIKCLSLSVFDLRENQALHTWTEQALLFGIAGTDRVTGKAINMMRKIKNKLLLFSVCNRLNKDVFYSMKAGFVEVCLNS